MCFGMNGVHVLHVPARPELFKVQTLLIQLVNCSKFIKRVHVLRSRAYQYSDGSNKQIRNHKFKDVLRISSTTGRRKKKGPIDRGHPSTDGASISRQSFRLINDGRARIATHRRLGQTDSQGSARQRQRAKVEAIISYA